jgi:hypothetical protein
LLARSTAQYDPVVPSAQGLKLNVKC